MVDGYKITLSDYLHQKAKLAPFHNQDQIDKKYVMDILVDDVLLLKEAERMELNQDTNFLAEVESFWRQSLINSLLKLKNQEIKNQITISEEEIKFFYNALKKEYFFRYIQLSVTKSDIKMPVENIDDNFLKTHPDLIKFDSGFNWSDIRSIEPQFRNQLMEPSIPLHKWFLLEDKNICYLLYLDNMKEKVIENYSDLKPEIETLLKEEKERQYIESWIVSLRKNAKITINQDLYSKI